MKNGSADNKQKASHMGSLQYVEKVSAPQAVARDTAFRRRAALKCVSRIKQNFAASRKIHKKSGHVPDFLYFESKKVSYKGTFFA